MAQEHQEYIQQKVNPILENLVTQLLLERPEHLPPFMIKWLSEHAKTPAAAQLTEGVTDLSNLKAELLKLREEVTQLETEVADSGGTTQQNPQPADDSEEEEEDDDVMDDVDDMAPPEGYLKKERTSVSAEAYGVWNVQKAFTAPVHPKSDEQKERIKAVLQKSFLFASLDSKDFDIVIGAMVEKSCETGTRIIEQGDDGDCLYVVESGQMNCYKKQPDGEEKQVKICQAGDAFGELALLYNCPRAASVVAHEQCLLWELDRETFNHIVRAAACKRRERYEEFLKNVPILDTMEAYERTQMCDALQQETHQEGDKIVVQGEAGDKFYILEEGECSCMKVYTPGSPAQEVNRYKAGDYFGELALLNGEVRAATVIAKTPCKTLTLSRRVFKMLLGPLEEILLRKSSEYK